MIACNGDFSKGRVSFSHIHKLQSSKYKLKLVMKVSKVIKNFNSFSQYLIKLILYK